MARDVPGRLASLCDSAPWPTERFDTDTFPRVRSALDAWPTTAPYPGVDHEETLLDVLNRYFPERNDPLGLLGILDRVMDDA